MRWNDRAGQARWKVKFNKAEGRQDPPGNGAASYETALLNSVEMYANTSVPYDANVWQLIRSYTLTQSWGTYLCDSRTGVTRPHVRLDSVVEHGSEGPPLPAWQFTYTTKPLRLWQTSYMHEMPYLAEVRNGYGGKVVFEYETDDNLIPGWGEAYNGDRKFWHVVKTRKVYDGRTDPGSVELYKQENYGGTGWRFSTYEMPSPDFRGYNIITVTDGLNPSYKREHRFFQGDDWVPGGVNRQRADGSSVADSEGLVGLEYEVRWLEDTTELKRKWTDYHRVVWAGAPVSPPGYDPDDNIYFSAPENMREYQGSQSSKKLYTYEDTYGNWVDLKEYLSAGDANWYRRRWQSFVANTAAWMADRPAAVAMHAWDGTTEGVMRSTTHYYYDGNPYLPPSNPGPGSPGYAPVPPGNLRAVRRWEVEGASSRFFDTFYSYDDYGNRIEEKVARGWGTDTLWGTSTVSILTTYDEVFNAFPKYVDNALAQRTTYVFDAKWGKPTSITDPNGGVSGYAYDVFGRTRAVAKPPDSAAYNSSTGRYDRATQEFIYWDGNPLEIETHSRKVASGGPSTEYHVVRSFHDGLGREIQRYGEAVSGHICVNTYYNNRGLKRRASEPHFIAAGGGFRLSDWNAWFTRVAGYQGMDHTYDALGRPRVTTLPDGQTTEVRYDPTNLAWATVDQNDHARRYEPDSLGRLLVVREYTGTDPSFVEYAATSYGYDVLDNLVSVRDALNNQTTILFDELGRKKQMTDPDMGTWSYVYDAPGSIIQQTDAKGQVIGFVYDVLHRPTRKQYALGWVDDPVTTSQSPGVYDLMELRGAVDADRLAAGVAVPYPFNWSDAAIVAGTGVKVRAVHLTEMREQAIQGLWDAASMGNVPPFSAGAIAAGTRVISLRDPGDLRAWLTSFENSGWAGQNGRKARAVYRYDNYSDDINRGYPIGRRTEMWDVSGRVRWTYDIRGRIITEERWIDGQYYKTEWLYDAMDRVVTMTYPDTEVVTYTYNAQLLLAGVSGSLVGSVAADLVYNALSQPTQVRLSNAVADMFLRYRYYVLDFGSFPYGALWDIRLEKGTELLRLQHGYDPGGNVTRIIDSIGTDFSYEYDHLDRLLKRKITGGADQETLAYDQVGNIMNKNGLSYAYGTKAHAVTNDGAQTYDYDANGNMIRRGTGQYLKYDAENRVVKVSSDSGGGQYVARFSYDGDGKRVKRVDNYGTVHYVGPHYERNVGTGRVVVDDVTKYCYGAKGMSRLIALWRGGALYYVCPDHLGSTLRTVGVQGNLLDDIRYHAYGATRLGGTNTPTDKRFTGQTLDMATGLYWYASRPYDPVLGRFTQADTVVPAYQRPNSSRAMTRRWISLVPSTILKILASLIIRSTG
ncbi:MAG: RHS repeat protein [Chloroflexi bacterium]|nr:RHS repeat protein [Chloroflexota bacterium]